MLRRRQKQEDKVTADPKRQLSYFGTAKSDFSSSDFGKGQIEPRSPASPVEAPAAVPVEVHGESAVRTELPGLEEKSFRPELPTYSSHDQGIGSEKPMKEKS